MSIRIYNTAPGGGGGGGGSQNLQQVLNAGNTGTAPGQDEIILADTAVNNLTLEPGQITFSDFHGNNGDLSPLEIFIENSDGSQSMSLEQTELTIQDSSANAVQIDKTRAYIQDSSNNTIQMSLIAALAAIIYKAGASGFLKTFDFSSIAPTANRTITVKNASGLNALDPVIDDQSGNLTYTFALSDDMNYVLGNNAATQTFTVPTNATAAFRLGATIQIFQLGTGKITIAAAGGVSINSLAGNLSTGGQYVGVSLVKVSTNTWLLCGNLQA